MTTQIDNKYLESLDHFSSNTETNINNLIDIRNFLSTIKTFEEFDNSKSNIIADLFEIEDCLRTTYDYLKKKYFEEKKLIINHQLVDSISNDIVIIDNNKDMMSDESKLKNSFYFNYNDEKSLNKQNETSPHLYYNHNEDMSQRDIEKKHYHMNIKYDLNEIDVKEEFCSLVKDKDKLNNTYQNNHQTELNYETDNNNKSSCNIIRTNANTKNYSLNDLSSNDLPIKINYQKRLSNEMQIAVMKNSDNKDNKPKINNANHSNFDLNQMKQDMSHLYNPSLNNEIKTETINNFCPGRNDELNTVSSNQKDSINSMNHKLRASRVADLIMKINSNEDLYEMMTQIFSNTILDDLISSKANNDLIDSVEEAVKEIERLQAQDNTYTNDNCEYKEQLSNNQLAMNNMRWINAPKSTQTTIKQCPPCKNGRKQSLSNYKQSFDEVACKQRNYSKDLLNKYPKKSKGDTQSYLKETNFESSLRGGCKSPQGRIFNNYTTPRSGYFDPTLQNGGQSKLSSKKKNLKGRKDFSPIHQYINYTLQKENNTVYQFTKSNI